MFVLQLKEHTKFKRKGDDLFVEHTLALTEALCGFQFPLTHLDGRQLLIKSNAGEIVKPGTALQLNCLLFLLRLCLVYLVVVLSCLYEVNRCSRCCKILKSLSYFILLL